MLMAQRWEKAATTEKAQSTHLCDVGDDGRGVGLTDEADNAVVAGRRALHPALIAADGEIRHAAHETRTL